MSSEFIVSGPKPEYEPSKGGLGVEIYTAMMRNKNKLAQINIESDETQTYSDLLSKSIKTAKFLQELKIGKDDFVSMCSSNNSNSSVPFLAAQFIGAKYFSMDPGMTEEDMIYAFRYIQPKIIFVESEAQEKIQKSIKANRQNVQIVAFGKSFNDILTKFNDQNFNPVFIDDLKETALILFTSGTTGQPKAICINHYSLLAQTVNIVKWSICLGTIRLSNFTHEFPDNNLAKIMTLSPMYWITGIIILLSTAFTGNCRVLGANFSPEKVSNAIKKYQVNWLFLPPGQVNEFYFSNQKSSDNDSLKIFVTGGGPVRPSHLKNMKECFSNAQVTQIYGQSEQTGQVSAFDLENPKDKEYLNKHPDSCGRPSFGISVKICDNETNQTIGPNQEGELRIKHGYFMNGYYKIDSSVSYDNDGWFKTGDLAKIDENGYIYILDRIKDILLYTVYNINTTIIEDILAENPAVLESFVIGIPHAQDNEHPMGVVLLKDEYKGKQSEEEIIRFVNDRVPADKYKLRAGIKFVDTIDKTITGKVKKNYMKNLILQGKI